jgi:Asp-tRNA(Asn)/Glu-tRNA(Gln) amidotransferase A subunit family amidase
MGALTSASATSLAGLIGRREVTAREVVEAHLRRIEAVDRQVNAVVQLDAERALARADGADGAVASGEPLGPLHGVPFTVKDTLAAAGIEMAMGAPERAGALPPAEATAVARVRAAGGILLGKTNCPVLLLSMLTER